MVGLEHSKPPVFAGARDDLGQASRGHANDDLENGCWNEALALESMRLATLAERTCPEQLHKTLED